MRQCAANADTSARKHAADHDSMRMPLDDLFDLTIHRGQGIAQHWSSRAQRMPTRACKRVLTFAAFKAHCEVRVMPGQNADAKWVALCESKSSTVEGDHQARHIASQRRDGRREEAVAVGPSPNGNYADAASKLAHGPRKCRARGWSRIDARRSDANGRCECRARMCHVGNHTTRHQSLEIIVSDKQSTLPSYTRQCDDR